MIPYRILFLTLNITPYLPPFFVIVHLTFLLLALCKCFGVSVADPGEITNPPTEFMAPMQMRSVNNGGQQYFIPYIFKRSAHMEAELSKNISGRKIFRDQKYFGTKNISGPKIFRDQKYF